MNQDARSEPSGGFLSGLGRKALALVVVIVAAYVLFKVVIGFVLGMVWIVVLVLAVIAVFWAMSVLRR